MGLSRERFGVCRRWDHRGAGPEILGKTWAGGREPGEGRGRDEPSGGPGQDLIHGGGGGGRAETEMAEWCLAASWMASQWSPGRGHEWLAGQLEPPAATHLQCQQGLWGPEGLHHGGPQPGEPPPEFTLLQERGCDLHFIIYIADFITFCALSCFLP